MWKIFLGRLKASFLKKLFIYFRDRGREGEREGEKHQCTVDSCAGALGTRPTTQSCCPDWESDW